MCILFDGKLSFHCPNVLEPYARYNASTDDEMKKYILSSFRKIGRKVRFLVASIAFGMGVDCKDVNTVLHFGPHTRFCIFYFIL